MSILIVLKSRIWFCFISVIGHCSTVLLFYIFTLIYCQCVAILLACFFYLDGGCWFGRYVVFHYSSLFSVLWYYFIDFKLFVYIFLILYLYILSHCNICFDMAYILCLVTNSVSNRFFWPSYGLDKCTVNDMIWYMTHITQGHPL